MLMEQGALPRDDLDAQDIVVARGMDVIDNMGNDSGFVAAVLVCDSADIITHFVLAQRIVLAQKEATPRYHLLSVDAIAQVHSDCVQLVITQQTIEELPAWHNSLLCAFDDTHCIATGAHRPAQNA